MSENQELSERELEILRLVATGASNKEVAKELVISVNTVKVHLRNIFNKLEVSSRTEASMVAINMGLVDVASTEQGQELSADETIESLKTNNGQLLHGRWPRIAFYAVLLVVVLIAGGVGLWLMRNAGSASRAITTPVPLEAPRWQVLSPMPTARFGFAVATYAGDIFTIAGESEGGVVGVNESYNFLKDSWNTLKQKPYPVTEVQAASVGGKIYVPGGRLENGSVTDILEIYDPSEDSWEIGEALPTPLSAYALVAYEGKIYLFGGWDGTNYLDVVYVYSPDSDTWEQGPSMPTSRAFASAAIIGEKILVVGGTSDGVSALSISEEFSPEISLQSWESRSSMPEERFGMGVASIADTLYLVGGNGNYDSGYISYVYFPARDEWQPIETPITQNITLLRVTPLQTHLFFLGGRSHSSIVNQNQAFQAIYMTSLPVIR